MTNEELVEHIQAGENVQDNLAQLYEQNLSIIRKIVFPFSNMGEMDDLLQEAFFGLKKAAEGYEPDLGFKFTTYLDWPVRSAVQRYLQNCGQTIRIPAHMVEKISKYQKFKADFTQITGHEPVDKEYRTHLMVTSKELSEMRKYMATSGTVSIDQAAPGTEDLILADTLADPTADFEESLIEDIATQQGSALLWEAVSELPDAGATVIEGIYRDGKTLEEVADPLAVSKERVRQIRNGAIKQLREQKKVEIAAEALGYESSTAYKWGVQRFKDTNTSSTEYLALKHIEYDEQAKRISGIQKNTSSTVNLAADRMQKMVGYVPTGLQRLQELNAEIEERMSAYRANRTGRKDA